MSLLDNLENDLRVLGNSEVEIAGNLRALDIKGEIGKPYNCPISVFLKSKGYGFPSVRLNNIFVSSGPGGNKTFDSMETPYTIKNFVKLFDDGEYPELIQ